MTFPDNVILEVVYCHYIRKWIPLGRATKRCPSRSRHKRRSPQDQRTETLIVSVIGFFIVSINRKDNTERKFLITPTIHETRCSKNFGMK